MGNGGGPPSGVGVDRGLGNASAKSGGRSDNGVENASMNSNGRSDAELERARRANENMRNADQDLEDHPGLPKTLHVSANSLRNGYQTALTTNPNLTSGRSFGRTLHDLGLSDRETKDAEERAREEIKQAKKTK